MLNAKWIMGIVARPPMMSRHRGGGHLYSSRISVRDAIGRFAFFTIVTTLLLAVQGCPWAEGLAYKDDDLPGKYAVWAVDTTSNAAIVEKRGGGVGIDVVGSMVFAYGWNDDFIIAKQHPPCPDDRYRIDTSTTHWHLIEVKTKTVHGPLTEDAFGELRNELKVPPELSFTKTIQRDL